MRLAPGHKRMIMDNINIMNYCKRIGIDRSKFHQCNIEVMNGLFYFVLSKVDAPKFPDGVFGCDLRGQPDIVLIVKPDAAGNLIFLKTQKTHRIMQDS